MANLVLKHPNFKLKIFIPKLGTIEAVIDPSCNYSVIPEKIYPKLGTNWAPWFKVLQTNFGKQKTRMIWLFNVEVLKHNIGSIEAAMLPNATKIILGKNFITALLKNDIEFEYRISTKDKLKQKRGKKSSD